MRKNFLFVLPLSIFLLLLPFEGNAAKLNNKNLEDAALTYGFVFGQENALREISKKYPALAMAAKYSESLFNLKFSSSIKTIESEFSKFKGWKENQKSIKANAIDNYDINQISYDQAKEFIFLVARRAYGEIETPIIETLLMFNPIYDKKPVIEFTDGHRNKYSSDGSGKAKGVKFSIEVPRSWASKVGNRPNIVRKFVSENGTGLEIIMILIKNMVLPTGQKITKSDIQKLLNPNDIKSFLPPDSIYLNSGSIDIEGQPGFWLQYRLQAVRVKSKIKMDIISYSIFYKNKFIQIQGQVAAIGDTPQNKIDERFKKFEPVFESVANTLIFPQLYQ